jgi:hypothetical protein
MSKAAALHHSTSTFQQQQSVLFLDSKSSSVPSIYGLLDTKPADGLIYADPNVTYRYRLDRARELELEAIKMQLLPFLYPALLSFLLLEPASAFGGKKNPKDAILLSNVSSS